MRESTIHTVKSCKSLYLLPCKRIFGLYSRVYYPQRSITYIHLPKYHFSAFLPTKFTDISQIVALILFSSLSSSQRFQVLYQVAHQLISLATKSENPLKRR